MHDGLDSTLVMLGHKLGRVRVVREYAPDLPRVPGYGGELNPRPKSSPSLRELGEYNYFRRNVAGVQREWWSHRAGCGEWFIAERDTRTNDVHWTAPPGEVFGEGAGAAATGADGSGLGT